MRNCATVGCFIVVLLAGAAAASAQLDNETCFSCHGSEGAPAVNQKIFEGSVHGALECIACHTDVTEVPHPEKLKKVDCTVCHGDIQKEFHESIHAQLAQKNVTDLPSCPDCHGKHNIYAPDDLRSMVNHFQSDARCLKCHTDTVLIKKHPNLRSSEFINKYTNSVHGRGVHIKGLLVSATCSDCHGAHKILPASDPNSTVNPRHVPDTCKKCHLGIYEDYITSVHGQKWLAGEKGVPVCTTCHTEHAAGQGADKTFKRTLTSECGTCHNDKTKSYHDTFHGKAVSMGFNQTAKCSDCHTAHLNFPQSDPRSSVNKANLVKTCSQCHDNVNAHFIQYEPHLNPHNKQQSPPVYYIYLFMNWLLIGVFSFWGVHTLMWLQRTVVAIVRKEVPIEPTSGQFIGRFNRRQRILHAVMVTSFIGLTTTGIPMKYHDMGWALWMAHMLGGMEAMRFYHRLFAIVTLGYFTYHIFHVYRSLIAQKKFNLLVGPYSMIPWGKDFVDLYHNLRWFLYLGQRPKYEHWTYFEKFDYFAVFWGVPVIGLSGLIMWQPTFFTMFLPGWILNAAAIIHSDEAMLAIAFIFTIHFFHNHMRPENFPIDLVIFTGVIPIERFIKERPAEYERLVREGKLEEHIVPPPSRETLLKARIFGYSTLALGLILIVIIFATFVFGR